MKEQDTTPAETPEPESAAAEEAKESLQPDNPDHEQNPEKTSRVSRWQHLHRFKAWYLSRKKWSIPATVVIVLLILGGVPWTRYHAAGLVLKKNFTVQVTDSTSNTPVSGAIVTADGVSGTTNASGKATLMGAKVGQHTIAITKKYYTAKSVSLLVPILKQKTTPNVMFVATGRQVKIKVTNFINAKVLSGVDIKVADTTAKTDTDGTATVVLPADASSQKATLSLDGYNDSSVTVRISNNSIQENDFKLVPAGKVYFLSKLSGTIDVVKTNLDGSQRKTVLAGTGSEDDQGTVLLASRDWKYLALLSQRAGDSPSLYLIDTSDDTVTTIDSGNATYNLVGWSGYNFVYTVARNDFSPTQPHGEALKSYDAVGKQLILLDQTNAAGNDSNNWAHETYPTGGVFLTDKNVVYVKQWDSYQGLYVNDPTLLANKQNGIYSIGPDGKNAQTLKTFDLDGDKYETINSITYKTDGIYFQNSNSGGVSYFSYSNGKITNEGDLSQAFNTYYSSAITYLQSPSGNNTFWAEPRDGKNTLLVGDDSGGSGKQVATLSDYSVYGWYTDNYLLVSKNSSELYILPVSGIKSDSQALKITDYHKPAQTYNGYGGGYGGL